MTRFLSQSAMPPATASSPHSETLGGRECPDAADAMRRWWRSLYLLFRVTRRDTGRLVVVAESRPPFRVPQVDGGGLQAADTVRVV